MFDASEALAGDGWHGTMAYATFTRPLWSWLAERDIDQYWGVPAALEDGRRPFRWDQTTWDHELLSWHQQLIRLRRTHPALVTGGMRWVHTSDDVVVYERAHPQETLIVHAARRAHEPLPCPVSAIDMLGHHNLSPGEQLPAGLGFGVWRIDAHDTES